MNRVVVFPFAPTFCAFGSSTMDTVHLYERSRYLHLVDPATHEYLTDYETFNRTVEALEEEAERDFAGDGYARDQIEYTLELDMKFGGQLNVKRATSPVIRVASEQDVVAIREAFEQEYAQAYSPMGLNPEAGIDIHNFVLRGRVAQPKPTLPEFEPGPADASEARTGSRRAFWGDLGWVDTPVYGQDALRAGHVIAGPAIVEAEDTTVVVDPGWSFTIGRFMDGILEYTEQAPGRSHAEPASVTAS
jgi:N-methylhydantoinase A/oxoprolinase/acetone carboxylase beta subunit